MLLYAYSLTEPYSNNMAENNALIIRLQRINEMGEKYLEAYGNSKLIISQVKGEYDVKNKDLVPYHQATIPWAEKFTGFYIDFISRKDNTHAEAVASLVATLALSPKLKQKVLVTSRTLYHPKEALVIKNDVKQILKNKTLYETSTSMELRDWWFPFVDFVLYDTFPKDPKEVTLIKRRVDQFYYNAIIKQLYRKSYDRILIPCLSQNEAQVKP